MTELKTKEMDDHEIIGLNIKISSVVPSEMTKPEQDESMIVSSSDESAESNDFSTFSSASANLSESYSVTGTKGSPNTVYSDSESIYSVKDDDCWNADLGNTSDDESEAIKLDNDRKKYTKSHNYRSQHDIILEEEKKHAVGKKHPLNIVGEKDPVKVNFQENKYVPYKNSHAAESVENGRDSKENVTWKNKNTEKNNKEMFISKQLDSDRLQTPSSQPFSTSKLGEEDTCVPSTKSLFASNANETIKSKWDKLIGKNPNKASGNDTTGISINKDSPLPSKQSRITTGYFLESLKNKAKSLSLIYNKFKTEMPQTSFLENIPESKLPESINKSLIDSSLSKNMSKDLSRDSTQLENKNTASGEANGHSSPLIIPDPHKEIQTANIDSSFSECDSSQEVLCKFYNKLDSVQKEVSENLSCQENHFQKQDKLLISKDDAFHPQKRKRFSLEHLMNDKGTSLRDNGQGYSMNAFMPFQEIKYSAVFNDIGRYGSQTPVSFMATNYKDTNSVYCDCCKNIINGAYHSKMIGLETVTTIKTEKQPLMDSVTSNIDIFLQIFNTDNILAKHILLAVSSKELSNIATYTNIIKYLRKKTLFSSKLLKDVKAFLQASVNAQILKIKGKRYILADGIGLAKAKHNQDIKKKEEGIFLGKKNLRKQVTAKKRKIQTNVEMKTSRKLSRSCKMETKSRKHGNPSKNSSNKVVRKKSKKEVKAKSNVKRHTAGKKINRKGK